MDSISQFVLGAAVGEAVLGKKIGNRALMWGGIAGTIPDLDVLASPLLSEVDGLAFHRGFSHSITFAVLGGLLFGWLLYKLYAGNEKLAPDKYVNLKCWQWMFFLAFFTHSLLDCFTMYGTQLFSPFSNFRVAFSTVSVADPMYTIPFLLCLLALVFLNRKSALRKYLNYIGIAWSCLYLTFTVVNKSYVKDVFESQLKEQNISYKNFVLGPTILNNILWSATIETDSVYYQGQYSLFDKSAIEFKKLKMNHELIDDSVYDRTINILKWFTAGYYNIIVRRDGDLQFNDLRYGTFRGVGDSENDFIFRFILKKSKGKYYVEEAMGGPKDGDEKEMIAKLIERIKGI